MKVSACVITKDEEKNINTCLESLRSVADEILVVDTGSVDKTVELANKAGATVLFFEWANDFSAARNYALDKVTGDWIVFLDADEFLTEDAIGNFPKILEEAEMQGMDAVAGLLINYDINKNSYISEVLHIRVFKNCPFIKYQGAIHERIVHKKRPLKSLNVAEKLKIIHTGYTSDPKILQEKAKRNLNSLYKELENKPQDSDLCFYISEALLTLDDYQRALEYANRAKTYKNSILKGMYEKNWTNILFCMQRLGIPESKIVEALHIASNEYPEFPDFYFDLGNFYVAEDKISEAIEVYNRGLARTEKRIQTQSNSLFRVPKVLHTLTELYRISGDQGKSLTCYIKLLQLDKYDKVALTGVLSILSHESTSAIKNFLGKLYDFHAPADLQVVADVATHLGMVELVQSLQNNH